MNWTEIFYAVILGIVEGATEFLPVSSTGHLIITGDLLGLTGERIATFEIFIQLGAIIAVAWDRRNTIFHGDVAIPRLSFLLTVAFLPAAVIGLLTHSYIKQYLFSSRVVAWALIVGAIVMVIIESMKLTPKREKLTDLTWKDALGIGFAQCLALFPGVSRAAATILGGLCLGLRRPLATEFSFLLAIPTIGAATVYDLLKSRDVLAVADVPFFSVGLIVSFFVALVVVRWLLAYVRTHDFRPFAVWRIVVGATILLLGIDAGT